MRGFLLPEVGRFVSGVDLVRGLFDHIQKLTEFTVKPFEGRRFRRLVIGMGELLNGEILKVCAHDLFG